MEIVWRSSPKQSSRANLEADQDLQAAAAERFIQARNMIMMMKAGAVPVSDRICNHLRL
jgi:hypothetical protein